MPCFSPKAGLLFFIALFQSFIVFLSMFHSFQTFVLQQDLLTIDDRVLLSVSGGIDSMVMATLFDEAGIDVGIAHCNYQLRGEESDADAYLVEDWAEERQLPFHLAIFETEYVAKKQKLSIQEAARDLRYKWLEEVCRKYGYSKIATAHHQGDAMETFLLNFSKGTGIRGLRGIPMRRGQIIRPLLFATRTDIRAYAQEKKVAFREDASNQKEDYDRNKIRLKVIPVLKQINPGLEKATARTLENIQKASMLYDWAVQRWKEKCWTENDQLISIQLPGLRAAPAPSALLHEWLSPLGFKPEQTQSMLEESTAIGSLFPTADFEALLDRTEIIIRKKQTPGADDRIVLEQPDRVYDIPGGKLSLKIIDQPPAVFSDNPFITYLDADKCSFPLILRRWKPGDVFAPLGMDGKHKKLKDFLRDEKLNRFEKEMLWILESNGQICWILGLRINENHKIVSSTKKILNITFQPNPNLIIQK
jgi:tRNA(Ile)-lysidine synthase